MTARDRKTGALAFLLLKIAETIDYRTERAVTEMVVYERMLGRTGYYICPRCDCTLNREFVRFCDRCGQKLNWSSYMRAKIRNGSANDCSETSLQETL